MPNKESIKPKPKKRGGFRAGAGRPKGSKCAPLPTIFPDQEIVEQIPLIPVPASVVTSPPATMEALKRGGGPKRGPRKTPLEQLYRIGENSRVPWSVRRAAWADAAQYVHAKQPQAVHVTSEVRIEAVVVHVETGPWNGGGGAPVLPQGPGGVEVQPVPPTQPVAGE